MTGTGGAERQGFRFQVLGGIGARHTAKGTQGGKRRQGSKGTRGENYPPAMLPDNPVCPLAARSSGLHLPQPPTKLP